MRKIYFLVILFLILAIFLSGCSIVTTVIPGINQEERVKGVVNSYWSALSNRQYGLAKSYCILHGEFYYLAEQYQGMPYIGSSTIRFIPYFNWTGVTGNNAKTNINLTVIVTICYGNTCSSGSETLYNYTIYLAKIGGAWKLK
jgi:uncharacterized protein YceK